ncbi:hypothetical protein U5A82_07690 [Sphingobium sp. CR2-8]|uniref:hypothetical protein n=1 Tax=Sphingobium sp. CR2-8 TaxID=1306534 RepID=UPI002DC0103B|nr:hypothetical protein [Sphingobium sp. CR2-8]MEC3910365.1 hypothetical protein [Sphingobium sp. CR2-8]
MTAIKDVQINNFGRPWPRSNSLKGRALLSKPRPIIMRRDITADMVCCHPTTKAQDAPSPETPARKEPSRFPIYLFFAFPIAAILAFRWVNMHG